MANNEFLVSVANAVLRDPNTGNAIMFGKTNITSAFTMSMTATEVRGGINNPLLYVYFHDKKLEIKIEQAVFNKTVLALNAGTTVLNSVVNVTQTDCLVLSSGSATLSSVPVGNVTVFLPDGTIQTVVPTGSTITVSGGGAQKVDAVYITAETADQVTVETTTPPSVVDCTLIAEVRDNTGIITNYLQVQIPRLQVTGNYTMSFAANGVSQQALEGNALEVASTDCASGAYYAKVTWIPVSGAAIAVSSIAAIPGSLAFSVAAAPATKSITVLGIRGGTYANANITTSCSFVVSGSVALGFTVGANTGVVTGGSLLTASHVGEVRVTYYDATNGSLVDTIQLSATA